MRKLFLFLALAATTLAYASAYTPSTVPDPKKQGQDCYVSNPDNIISGEYETYLNDLSKRLYEKTLVELATVALESIGDADAFDFSYELFQRWGIGGKDRNTGVLILFVLDSHDIRITTGTGIEGVLTDAHCAQILRTQMVPWFMEGGYENGLLAGAFDIYQICTDGETPEELQSVQSVTYRAHYDEYDDEDEDDISLFVVVFFFGLLVFLLIWAYLSSIKTCPECKKFKAHASKWKTIVPASYVAGGKQEVTYICKNCGHTFVVTETTPKLTHSSSSGGRSYGGGSHSSGGSWGGGSTSGGGAGGKW